MKQANYYGLETTVSRLNEQETLTERRLERAEGCGVWSVTCPFSLGRLRMLGLTDFVSFTYQ